MPAEKRKRAIRRANDTDEGRHQSGAPSDRVAGTPADHPLTLRLAERILDRVDELIPYVADDMEFAAMGRVSRSQVLRIAVLQGLKVLSDRYEVDG